MSMPIFDWFGYLILRELFGSASGIVRKKHAFSEQFPKNHATTAKALQYDDKLFKMIINTRCAF
jgi:hypothetical protein